MTNTVLVRYGAIPEVGRFRADEVECARGREVVVRTHRGPQIGTVLEVLQEAGTQSAVESPVERAASDEDAVVRDRLRAECEDAYAAWCERIRKWNLDLELLDLEWTLDHDKLILYVLNDRGPDCTQLALQAAAAGLGVVEVQPVAADGPVALQTAGGCGSGGCSH